MPLLFLWPGDDQRQTPDKTGPVGDIGSRSVEATFSRRIWEKMICQSSDHARDLLERCVNEGTGRLGVDPLTGRRLRAQGVRKFFQDGNHVLFLAGHDFDQTIAAARAGA